MQILSAAGDALDATFSLRLTDDGAELTLESRGPGRNTEYTDGLRTLLGRLGALDALLVDAYLDTRETQRQRLSREQRRLALPAGASYPLRLSTADVDATVASLEASQAEIGQAPGARGGNVPRRMTLLVRPARSRAQLPALLEATLAGSTRVGVVYVPRAKPSPKNLSTGVEHGVWGFKPELMARSNYLQAFRMLREGDMIFLGHGGPDPRVGPGGWRDARIQAGHLGMITHLDETATDSVWEDGVYPYRIYVDFLSDRRDFSAAEVGEEVMEALRLSANQQGRAVVQALGGLMLTEGPEGAAGPLTLDGPLDVLVSRAARREQAKLRKQRFGTALEAPCDLCSYIFPVRHLRIAHIKQRSFCSEDEKRDRNVVMAACIGCDALYENGDIVVDAHGVIRASNRNHTTPDLQRLVDALAGKRCRAFSPATAAYFAFHRDR